MHYQLCKKQDLASTFLANASALAEYSSFSHTQAQDQLISASSF